MIEPQSNTKVAKVKITSHRLFPPEANDVEAAHVVQGKGDTSKLWHKRYGHLNLRSLKYLSKYQLVKGLLNIMEIQLCEACVIGKQAHQPFPK